MTNQIITIITTIIIPIIIMININKYIIKPISNYINSKIISEQLSYTDELFNRIDECIKNEVVNKIKYAEMSGEKYKLLNYDEDVKNISQDVKNAFNIEILGKNQIHSPIYIYKYIASKVALLLFQYINDRDTM